MDMLACRRLLRDLLAWREGEPLEDLAERVGSVTGRMISVVEPPRYYREKLIEAVEEAMEG